LVRKPEGNSHFEDPDVDGRTIPKWISEKEGGMVKASFIWLRTGTSSRQQTQYSTFGFQERWGIS
jgi:hypothetical protein